MHLHMLPAAQVGDTNKTQPELEFHPRKDLECLLEIVAWRLPPLMTLWRQATSCYGDKRDACVFISTFTRIRVYFKRAGTPVQ